MKPKAINQAWNGTEKCQLCPIRDLVLFADLKQEDFNFFHFPIKELEFKAGETIYKQNDTINFVYTIRSGLVKLVHYLPNGNYRITRLLRQGDLAGIEALNGADFLQQAIAMKNTSICRIPVQNIDQLNSHSTHLYSQLTARWQKVQSDADIWLSQLTMGSSKHRVANLLLYLASNSHSEGSFFLPCREDIGALLAITTETASRVIAEFNRTGFLESHKNSAKIHPSKLNLA